MKKKIIRLIGKLLGVTFAPYNVPALGTLPAYPTAETITLKALVEVREGVFSTEQIESALCKNLIFEAKRKGVIKVRTIDNSRYDRPAYVTSYEATLRVCRDVH